MKQTLHKNIYHNILTMNVTNVDEIIARNKLLEEENAKLKDELDGKIMQIYLQKKPERFKKLFLPDRMFSA